jgi:hypothetical protein
VARPAVVFGTLALFAFSFFYFVQHVRAGDAFTFAWGHSAEQQRAEARKVADFKLGQVANTLEGVKAYTGSYWTGEVEWNTELRIAWATDTSYCVEIRDTHGVYHRRTPGPERADDGPCPVA